jgi:diguanylate cyclase (GGDEF)-like protein
MKRPNFLDSEIATDDRESFWIELLGENMHRGKILAFVIIGFETVLLLTDIITSLLRVDSRFAFDDYLMMYSIMIAVTAVYLLTVRTFRKYLYDVGRKRNLETIVIVYITFVMSWGSVVSLMDQKLYGQLLTFMVNMIVCSVIYLLDNRKILIPYAVSVLILALGLPFFQESSDILIGHYVNLAVFISISWLTSRILYHNFVDNFNSSKLLDRYNRLLENEIDENKRINARLEAANKQLQGLALLDELTGIPNRRSFREFIERAFPACVINGSTLSLIMIDIDFFKQFNDRYGHEAGDKTLIAVANQINAVVREPGEFVTRWGGEEFVYASFNKAEEETAQMAATIGAKVSELRIAHDDSPIAPYITVSIGLCTIPLLEKRDVTTAIRLADRALYAAKNGGRNRIVVAGDDASDII